MNSDGSSPYQHSPASDELAPVPRYSWPVRIALGLSVAVILFVVLVVGLVFAAGWKHSQDMQQMRLERQVVTRILKEDPERFGNLEILDYTPRYVWLVGTVSCDEDRQYLRARLNTAFKGDTDFDRLHGVTVSPR